MLTPKEHLKAGLQLTHELWIDGLELVTHCLKKDCNQTFFKHQYPSTNHWEDWADAIANHTKVHNTFNEIFENAYVDKPAWHCFDNDSGILEVSGFIAGDDLCFEDEEQLIEEKQSVSVLLDMSVHYGARTENYMVERQQKVYDIVAQCESENRPVQVLGCYRRKFTELKKPLTIFIQVKNYNDSIFPTIWGGLKDNPCTNDFLNVIADYFIGTHSMGNGSAVLLDNAEKYFPQEEELIIFGDMITK